MVTDTIKINRKENMKAYSNGDVILDSKVKMTVAPYLRYQANARRGQKAVKKPTVFWCIVYEYGGMFTFSYYRKSDAINAMNLMKQYGTDTVRYRDFNIVKDVNSTLHVWPKNEESI